MNVLEWAFQDPAVARERRARREATERRVPDTVAAGLDPGLTPGAAVPDEDEPLPGEPEDTDTGPPLPYEEGDEGDPVPDWDEDETDPADRYRIAGGARTGPDLTVVVLAPHDPMTRGQLRRVAELARDEGLTVDWQEARDGAAAPVKTIGSLAAPLRRARRIVIGDPFSRYVQLLLTLTSAPEVVVVDDGTATMEFAAQLARSERFVRWHRKGAGGPRAALFAPFSQRARSRLTPGPGRRVELFSSMPVEDSVADLGVALTRNAFAWTRSRFGPPRLTRGTDLVGTSLVETGVVDMDRYLEAVAELARAHGATRYFAHRRENAEKLAQVTAATGLEIVRPDLPLELVARRGPIGRTILSFPSTVVHTLPLALTGTPVTVAVCDIDPSWLTDGASPRAEGFLSGVTGTARGARRLGSPGAPSAPGPSVT
ncbi:hypothetical protein HCC30_05780 [Streptomyces sp. HNM0574]|nr:hypothetical protein [Streptomyces sp. HNM0574]